jgi:hypothetical protein
MEKVVEVIFPLLLHQASSEQEMPVVQKQHFSLADSISCKIFS